MNPDDIAQYIATVLPAEEDGTVNATIKDRRRSCAALVWAGRGAELAGADSNGSTAWGAYNAVCEYFDHVRPAEARSNAGIAKANESALFGANANVKLLALKRARQLVAV